MSVTVRIPTPLQKLTQNQGEVNCNASNVAELIDALEKEHPGFKDRLCEKDGKLRRFVNIYINDEDIRFMQGEQSTLKAGDEVSIIPAIAGG